ncbi:MAG: phage major capsid protein [Planctomycetota bacterium]|jgi:hypothetical protein
MATLTATDILDLSTATLAQLNKLKFSEVIDRLRRYVVMPKLLKERVMIQDGKQIDYTFMVDDSGQAKQVGLYEQDDVNVGDVLDTISIPWRHTVVPYAWERRELLMNRGVSQITNLLKIRRADAMVSLTKHMEDQFWGVPTGTTDKKNVFGIQYWLTTSATEGFNGGDHASFTAGPGGMSASDVTGWQNYTADYTNVTDDDLLQLMLNAKEYTNFESIVDANELRSGGGNRIYTTYPVKREMTKLARNRNDNLGADLAVFENSTLFAGVPIFSVPWVHAQLRLHPPGLPQGRLSGGGWSHQEGRLT